MLAACLPLQAGAEGLRLVPSLDAGLSYLETRGSREDNGREAVMQVSPGLTLRSNGGRLQGSLNYVGSALYRVGRAETHGGEWLNALNASFLAEAVPSWAYVDGSATISQQSISAFGQPTTGSSLRANKNRTEVATVSMSPYLRGRIGSVAVYEARVNGSITRTRDSTSGDSHSQGASVSVSSPSRGAMVGWTVAASQQRNETDNATDDVVDNRRLNAAVTINPNPELQLTAGVGREAVDGIDLAGSKSYANTNVGLQWTPSARTRVAADLSERYFGRNSRVSFLHRAARTVWNYSYSRDASNGADGRIAGPSFKVTDILVNDATFRPDLTNAEARQLAAQQFLALQGRDAEELFTPLFLTSSFSVVNRHDASISWLGQRTSFTLQAYATSQSQILSIAGADPILGEPTRQHGYSSTLSYRLTPLTSVSLGGQRLMTFGNATQTGTDLKSANASLTSQLGARISASLSARYSVFNSAVDPYRETALSASLGLRF